MEFSLNVECASLAIWRLRSRCWSSILGPTASGKTALSLALASEFDGEIVNCDSVAMYREFDIGTAKPSAAERTQAPHHLFDCVDPTQDVTAGEYARQARAVLEEIKERHRLPIVVGGTGLYSAGACSKDCFRVRQRSEDLRERLRERVAERGSEYLHRILKRLDREAAGEGSSERCPEAHPGDRSVPCGEGEDVGVVAAGTRSAARISDSAAGTRSGSRCAL